MRLEILGKGCAKCDKLMQITEEVVREEGLDAQVVKVTDLNVIIGYGVVMTPALVKDGKVILSGKLPGKDELKKLILA